MESNPVIAIAGSFTNGKQTQYREDFDKIGIKAYESKILKEEQISNWSILLAGDKVLGQNAELVVGAKERKVPILNVDWAKECFKSKRLVEIKPEYLWDKAYNPTKENNPEKGGPKEGQRSDPDKPDGSEEPDSDEEPEVPEVPEVPKVPEVKKEEVEEPFQIDPTKADVDEERNAWYNEIKKGPRTIVLSVHPADVFNNVPDNKKRRNYLMWIECVYNGYMIVTDPKTEVFVEVPHFRDAYLLSANVSGEVRSSYAAEQGHSMTKQDNTTFTCELNEFDLWQIAYNGRMCLIMGKVPRREEDGGGRGNLGLWTRSDLQKKFGKKETDEWINRAFLGLGHGDPDEDANHFLTNGVLKKWKKSRGAAPTNTPAMRTRYQERGKKAKLEAALQ